MANVYEIEVDGQLVLDANTQRAWRCYNAFKAEREATDWAKLGSKSVVVIGPPVYGVDGRQPFACKGAQK
jgi:hypothetical protein